LITREHTQEALSNAYVHALAGSAGLNLAARPIFDYGLDGTFYPVKLINGERIQTGHAVDFQMKATTIWERDGDFVIYDLEARAHRFLADRERGMPMAILILLCMPKDPVEWLDGSEEHLRLRNCCYWYRFSGAPTTNVSSIRIRVPRINILTTDSLKELMRTARDEATNT
jgi:hypothetical protein